MTEKCDLGKSVTLGVEDMDYGTLPKIGAISDTHPQPFRTAIAAIFGQSWACFGKYLCMINIGLTASLPIILIPYSTSGLLPLEISQSDIKSIVSVIFMVMPLGAIISALPMKLTRKPPIIFTQALIVASWIGTYFSREAWHLILARAFGGLALTISQPHIVSYIGEVTLPKHRGIFGSVTQTMALLGEMIMSNLIYLQNWNAALIICCAVAIMSTCYLFLIPESPILLISYGRYNKAYKSLKQLRGGIWSDESEVRKEFEQLMRSYAKATSSTKNTQQFKNNQEIVRKGVENLAYEPEEGITDLYNCTNNDTITGIKSDNLSNNNSYGLTKYSNIALIESYNGCQIHNNNEIYRTPTNVEQPLKKTISDDEIPWCKYILLPKMYKPLLLVAFSAFFVVGPGSMGMTQYLLYVLQVLDLSDYYSIFLSVLTFSMLAGNITSICVVSKIGKKKIILISTAGAGFGYLGLLATSCVSGIPENTKVIVIGALMACTIFLEEFGLKTLYHSLLTELFPMRGKRIGPVVYVLLACLNGIVIGHTFMDVLTYYGIIPILVVDVILCFAGTIFFFCIFIETEGKSLKEIEESFEGKTQ